MTTSYFTIMMNHLEQMQVELAAAAESALDDAEPGGRGARPEVFDCTRLLLVTEGEGTVRVEDRKERLEPGVCTIILAGASHSIEPSPGRKLAFKWCHFRAKYGDRDLYKMLRLPLTVRMIGDEAGRLLDKIIRHSSMDELTSRLRIKASVLELICLYLESMPDPKGTEIAGEPSQEMAKIQAVLRYIDEHLADNITVEDLARLVYLHPNYFIVFFKGMMGCSPIQYVNQRRMETARNLLLQPDCNVSDVANRIGMKIYYFSRMFKTHTGMTPSRYRKLAAALPGNAGDETAAARDASATDGATPEGSAPEGSTPDEGAALDGSGPGDRL